MEVDGTMRKVEASYQSCLAFDGMEHVHGGQTGPDFAVNVTGRKVMAPKPTNIGNWSLTLFLVLHHRDVTQVR